MRSRRSFKIIALLMLLLLGISSVSHAEIIPPISLICPCGIERVNTSKSEIKFSVVFNKGVSESGDFTLKLVFSDSILGPGYIGSQIGVPSLPYSSNPTLMKIDLPSIRMDEYQNQYLYLQLSSGDDETIDRTALNNVPILFGDRYGSQKISDPFTFGSLVDFQYDAEAFSLKIGEVKNYLLKSSSEQLIINIIASNGSSYYTKFSSTLDIAYNSLGVGEVDIFGDFNYLIDGHLGQDPAHTNIIIQLKRGDTPLVEYLLDVLGDGVIPSFGPNLNNIDALLDTDGDGISDFNEMLIGTSVSEVSDIGSTPIEVAFTYGTSASDQYGAELAARLAHIVRVSNSAFENSGVSLTIKNVGSYNLGDDTTLDADLILEKLKNREDIFSNIDNVLERKPDFFIHLSTNAVLDIGGLAPVLSSFNDGLVQYLSIYDEHQNRAAVSIDNSSTTLAHEIGHLMGLTHSRRQADGYPTGTFPWSLGHAVDNDFATIMAYETEFGSASGLEFFSSPSLTCGDFSLPCGVDRNDYLAGADSVLTLKTTMHQIAAISNGFPPSISLAGEKTINLTVGASFSEPGFAAVDKEDGALTSSVSATGTVNTITAGTYSITYSVTDSDGNLVTANRSVIVSPDMDGDQIPDNTDDDRDGDGYINTADIFPDDSSEWYDSDADGTGDNADATYDPSELRAGYLVNATDTCSSSKIVAVAINGVMYPTMMPGDRFEVSLPIGNHVFTYYQDGLLRFDVVRAVNVENWYTGLACSWDNFELSEYTVRSDADNDSVLDNIDAFPQDSSESIDTDNDGIGNNADTDDDNDGVSDYDELDMGSDPLDANSVPSSGLSMILIKAFLDKQKAASQVSAEQRK